MAYTCLSDSQALCFPLAVTILSPSFLSSDCFLNIFLVCLFPFVLCVFRRRLERTGLGWVWGVVKFFRLPFSLATLCGLRTRRSGLFGPEVVLATEDEALYTVYRFVFEVW